MTMILFVEVTDLGTGEPALVGLPHIRIVRQDEEGRAVIWLSDPPHDKPFLAKESYRDVLALLTKRTK